MGAIQDAAGNNLAQRLTGDVELDRALPVVISATGVSDTSMSVVFSEPMNATEAVTFVDTTYYDLYETATPANKLTISAVVISTTTQTNDTVTLTTSAQTAGTANYTVAVGASVVDVNNNAIAANTTTFNGQLPALNVVSAAATNNTTVVVTFNQNISSTTGAVAGNYTINTLTVSSSVVSGATATLTTTSQISNTANGYTVTVANVQDVTDTITVSGASNSATFTGDTLPSVASISSIDATHRIRQARPGA